MDDYRDAIRYLYGLTRFGIKLGLDNTRRLAALAGDPHRRLRFIHVAGTNGKGTTCAMLESIYRHSGLKVGLFTSPHLVSFRERIQVNRELIPEEATVRLVKELRSLLDGEPDLAPTFFEFVTVMALVWFAEQKCELVILETGLGGRFDSTNIVTPLLSVITHIGLDHQDILGDTLAEIANEKAGIIKPGIPIALAKQQEEPDSVIRRKAADLNAEVIEFSPCSDLAGGLLGRHNRDNAGLAVRVVAALNSRFPVTDQQILEGLATYSWPGRLQKITRGDRLFILDGAHNADGFTALGESIHELGLVHKPTLILGVLGDKDTSAIGAQVSQHFDRVIVVPIASRRAGAARPLAAQLEKTVRTSSADSLRQALDACIEDECVVVAGSFYLIGEALELLDELPAGVRCERELNEWGR